MERLFGLPAHGDLALQLRVLPGKLLKHAVDCLRKSVEFARSAARCDAAREIAFDDGRSSAADFMHLGKQGTTNQPRESSSEDNTTPVAPASPYQKRSTSDSKRRFPLPIRRWYPPGNVT